MMKKRSLVNALILVLLLWALIALVGCGDIYITRSLTLDVTELEMEIDETVTINATVTPESYQNEWIFWESSNTSVAKVKVGVVTAVGEGSATITATSKNGKVATAEVTVLPPTVTFDGVTVEEREVFGSFASSAETVSLDSFVTKREDVVCTVSRDEGGEALDPDALPLDFGENLYYLHVASSDWSTTYTLSLYRRNVYIVTFDTAGGDPLEPMQVDEGVQTYLPSPTKYGYYFTGWRDGDKAISRMGEFYSDMHLTASWRIEDFYVSVYPNYRDAAQMSASKGYEYNSEVSVSVADEDNIGYTFLGWYDSDGNLLTNERSYSFTMGGEDVTLRPMFDVADELSGFTFRSTPTTCEITGVTDITKGSYVIPELATSIASGAFKNCRSLYSITIPEGVTSIGNEAFLDCINLIEVYNLSSLDITAGAQTHGYVGYYAKDVYTDASAESKISTDPDGFVFYDGTDIPILLGYTGDKTTLTLPDDWGGVKYVVAAYAFCRRNDITEVNTGDGAVSIGEQAFAYCGNLMKVTIGDSVRSIGDEAFKNCALLRSVSFGEALESIGASAFYRCISLCELVIPASVVFIGEDAFDYCSSLESVTFEQPAGWSVQQEWYYETVNKSITEDELSDPAATALLLTYTYSRYQWHRESEN